MLISTWFKGLSTIKVNSTGKSPRVISTTRYWAWAAPTAMEILKKMEDIEFESYDLPSMKKRYEQKLVVYKKFEDELRLQIMNGEQMYEELEKMASLISMVENTKKRKKVYNGLKNGDRNGFYGYIRNLEE